MTVLGKPSTHWKERIGADEAKQHAAHVVAFEEIEKIKSGKYGKGRLLHRKAQLGLHGSFEVLGNLPEHARQGLFSAPGNYEAWVRLSNGGTDRAPDKRPDVRGFALKIKGLKAPGALGSGDTECQDFLLINHRMFAFPNSNEFVGLVLNASRGGGPLLRYLYSTYGLLGTLATLKKFASSMGRPFSGFTTEAFHSAAPIACGAYATRVRLQPASKEINPDAGKDWAGDVVGRLAKAALRFELQLQFYVDEKQTPIEDASVDWTEEVSPYVTVGVLTLPVQDVKSPAGVKLAADIESAAFDPWGALMEHRPLGEVMRARKVIYYQSQVARRG